MTGLTRDAAMAAIAAVAERASGAVGLAARHLESGETLCWREDESFGTASMIKVAIHAAVLRRARAGQFGLDDEVTVRAGDMAGGSGVLAELRPGLRCTVSDLCTLMIVVSDNTATNMLIALCGGTGAVNDDFAALGFPGFRLNRPVSIPPPPLALAGGNGLAPIDSGHLGPACGSAAPGSTAPGSTDPVGPAPAGPGPASSASAPSAPGEPAPPAPGVPLATVSLGDFCELMARLHAGTVVDGEASARIIDVLRYQQHQALFPRAYLAVASPFDPPGAGQPALAHKTGYVSGCRTDGGLLLLPDGGGTVAYATAADGLADRSMTALAEGDEILGRLGAIVLARWWPGPGPAPVRDGWL